MGIPLIKAITVNVQIITEDGRLLVLQMIPHEQEPSTWSQVGKSAGRLIEDTMTKINTGMRDAFYSELGRAAFSRAAGRVE